MSCAVLVFSTWPLAINYRLLNDSKKWIAHRDWGSCIGIRINLFRVLAHTPTKNYSVATLQMTRLEALMLYP
jgi:hypothetical protein